MEFTLVDSTLAHVRELSKSIRLKDRQEAEALNLEPHKALYHSFRNSIFRRTCLVDNKVAAMWGVCGTPLGLVGQPYLVTGEICNEVSPIKFARIYIREVQQMRNLFPLLENYVHADYKGAVNMLRIAGFSLSNPIEVNNSSFLKFSMEN